MPTFKTHLTVLEESAKRFSSLPAFKVPLIDPNTQEILQWDSVSYSQFLADVEHFAKYWTSILSDRGVAPRSVVGVWYVLFAATCIP